MASKNSKKRAAIFAVVLIVCFAALWVWQLRPPEALIEVKSEKLRVLVAKNPKHQYKGLGGRDTLLPYEGMLFVFGFSRSIGIVMRDMRFPIDIVWFNNGEVVDIAPNVAPEPGVSEFDLRVYKPRVPANSVLELPAGWAERYDLKIGDKLRVLEE